MEGEWGPSCIIEFGCRLVSIILLSFGLDYLNQIRLQCYLNPVNQKFCCLKGHAFYQLSCVLWDNKILDRLDSSNVTGMFDSNSRNQKIIPIIIKTSRHLNWITREWTSDRIKIETFNKRFNIQFNIETKKNGFNFVLETTVLKPTVRPCFSGVYNYEAYSKLGAFEAKWEL